MPEGSVNYSKTGNPSATDEIKTSVLSNVDRKRNSANISAFLTLDRAWPKLACPAMPSDHFSTIL
jgi:hypothetical protein